MIVQNDHPHHKIENKESALYRLATHSIADSPNIMLPFFRILVPINSQTGRFTRPVDSKTVKSIDTFQPSQAGEADKILRSFIFYLRWGCAPLLF